MTRAANRTASSDTESIRHGIFGPQLNMVLIYWDGQENIEWETAATSLLSLVRCNPVFPSFITLFLLLSASGAYRERFILIHHCFAHGATICPHLLHREKFAGTILLLQYYPIYMEMYTYASERKVSAFRCDFCILYLYRLDFPGLSFFRKAINCISGLLNEDNK